MILTKKLLTHSIFLLFTIVISSCVQKAAENKAKCDEFEGFDAVTRTCFALSSKPTPPITTLKKATLNAQGAKRVALSYYDAGQDKALSCKATTPSNTTMLLVAPNVTDRTYFTVYDQMMNATSTLLSYSDFSALASPTLPTAYVAITATYNADTVKSLSTAVYGALKNLLTAATAVTPATAGATAAFELYKMRFEEFELAHQAVVGNCACYGGECFTVVVPKNRSSGVSGFTYTVTDKDGESNLSSVEVTISPLNPTNYQVHPIALSVFKSLNERDNNYVYSPSDYVTHPSETITLGNGVFDFSAVTASAYTFVGTKDCSSGNCYGVTSQNGRVYGCMDLYLSNGPSDNICYYRPVSFDDNNMAMVPTKASLVRLNSPNNDYGASSLDFTAKVVGRYGNDISVQFIDIRSANLENFDSTATKMQVFGYVNTLYGDAYVRVDYNKIKVFYKKDITTLAQIKSVIDLHEQAKHLVDVVVSGNPSDTANFSLISQVTPPIFNLAGGIDFDSFNYALNDGVNTSTSVASASISMIAQNDPAMVPIEYDGLPSVQTIALTEDQGAGTTFDVDFKDVDSGIADFTFHAKVFDPAYITTNTCRTDITVAQFNAVYPVMPYPELPYVGNPEMDLTINPGFTSAGFDARGIQIFKKSLTVQPLNSFSGMACLYYYVVDVDGRASKVQVVKLNVTAVNDAPLLGTVNNVTYPRHELIAELPATSATMTMNEDLAGGPNEYTRRYYMQPGGGKWENTQTISYSLTLTGQPLVVGGVPLPKCEGYTAITSLVGTFTTNNLYYNTTTKLCYKATSTSTLELYPSVTLIKVQDIGVTTEEAVSGVYDLVIIPAKDRSGTGNVQITLNDGQALNNTKVYDVPVDVLYQNDPPYFLATPTLVETVEGGYALAGPFHVDEDEAATFDEDAQNMTIEVTSDNANILPASPSNIKLFYDLNDNEFEDGGEEVTPVGMVFDLNDLAQDVKQHQFYLKLNPIAGQSGNANITVKATDSEGLSTSKTFSLVVYPIAAIHKGWANIKAVGIKTNKNDEPVDTTLDTNNYTTPTSDLKCNFNKSSDAYSCNGANCTGTVPPHSTVSADSEDVIYWDSSNKKCYISRAQGLSNWEEFNTSCPVTRAADACLDGSSKVKNCVGSALPTASIANHYYYNRTDKTCYYAKDKAVVASWKAYVPSKVTLEWNAALIVVNGMSGVNIVGYNIYRREVNSDYDFSARGYLRVNSTDIMSVTGTTTRTFTDTTAIAGKTYYYVVRPVVNALSTKKFVVPTAEIYAEVRLIAPQPNYAFVHRWMINQEICKSMNITEDTVAHKIDPLHNFRCQYVGPGRTDVNGSNLVEDSFYDIGMDMMVDTQEMGCSYSKAPKCTADGCVGIGAPVTNANNERGDLWYNRSAGTCHVLTGTGWRDINDNTLYAIVGGNRKIQEQSITATPDSIHMAQTALNPPLTNITKNNAKAICQARDIAAFEDLATPPTMANLPNRKEFVAYSAHRLDKNSNDRKSMEDGKSLNAVSVCNGSSANGLETKFVDSIIPQNALMYTIAGTKASQIRSLHTGSIPWEDNKSTKECVSRYGIQDVYGNVAEWNDETFQCIRNVAGIDVFSCLAENDTVNARSGFGKFDFLANGNGNGHTYGFDGAVGPHILTQFIRSYQYHNKFYNGSRFSFPMGLPLNDSILTHDSTDADSLPDFAAGLDWFLNIGNSSGILSENLHEDGMILFRNEPGIGPGDTNAYARNLASGGSYISTTFPGRFSMWFLGDGLAEEKSSEIGFRCMLQVPDSAYSSDIYHPYDY